MPVERRGWVIAFEIGSTGNGRNPIFNGRRYRGFFFFATRLFQMPADVVGIGGGKKTPRIFRWSFFRCPRTWWGIGGGKKHPA
jgi:hypothetical protein